MSVYDDVLMAVLDMAQQTKPYANIVVGSMPSDKGIAMAYANGALETYLNKAATITMTLVLNGKHSDQQTVLDALGKIHVALNTCKNYPASDAYQITNIKTISPPNYLGREENKQWLYGSSLEIQFFMRGA